MFHKTFRLIAHSQENWIHQLRFRGKHQFTRLMFSKQRLY